MKTWSVRSYKGQTETIYSGLAVKEIKDNGYYVEGIWSKKGSHSSLANMKKTRKISNIKIFNSKLSFARVSEQWTSLEGASKTLAYLSYPQENIGFILTIEINGCCLSSLIRKPVFPMKVGKVLWV